jgi:lysyl-tRNA synthetase class 2
MWAVPKTDNCASRDWHPQADLNTLRIRATLLARIRSFFSSRGVLEVDTPILSRFGTTDPAIDSFLSLYSGPGHADGLPLYLHTSPEFFMKRLLAAGTGAIYQLTHVFRNGEAGRRHNPEFMLLEWYRPEMDHHALMDEVDVLLREVLEGFCEYLPPERISYRQWFLDSTGLDPWNDEVAAFRHFARRHLPSVPVGMDDEGLDVWLDLLVSHWLEPQLAGGNLFVYGYPASQAALARVRVDGVAVADRFELYLGGVELANGFYELGDAAEQRSRFETDNRFRNASDRSSVRFDEYLIAALDAGLPDCSGVALGFDRLVMLAAGLKDIASTMPFAFARV